MAKGHLGDARLNRVGPRVRLVDLRRVFQTHAETLFDAWSDPAQFVRWFGPVGWQACEASLDLRVGGAWRCTLLRPPESPIRIGGLYREIDRPRRLVFTWDSYGTLAPQDLSLVTLDFIALGESTELVLHHQKLTTGEAEDMEVGWQSAFESLANYLVHPSAT